MIIRYSHRGCVQVGWLQDDQVVPVGDRLADLLQLRREDLKSLLTSASSQSGTSIDLHDVQVLAPIDGRTEVWAAGVTYEISHDARIAESHSSADVYADVYDADRPELFFKSVAWRVVPNGGGIRVRADSAINVAEPELALLINAHREVVGLGVSNDMSSRSIEADSPLYLPQAKIYDGSCSLGPAVTPSWQIEDPTRLVLQMIIERERVVVWEGTAAVSRLHRQLDELVDWLHRELSFPYGVWLSTGTCLVPDLPFTVLPADRITIDIAGVGTLINTVCV